MQLLPADYALGAIMVVLAILGLFRGLSGTIAFVLASAAASFVASFGWVWSASFTDIAWQRGGGVLLATLVAFGLVRACVKKLVHGLLAQPSDAIFGMLSGVVLGALVVVAWAWSGLHLEYSSLAQEVSVYVR